MAIHTLREELYQLLVAKSNIDIALGRISVLLDESEARLERECLARTKLDAANDVLKNENDRLKGTLACRDYDDSRIPFDPDHDQDDLCTCGHPYHRHFDGYESPPSPIGCKYCDCDTFISMGLSPKYIADCLADECCVVHDCGEDTHGHHTCEVHQANHTDRADFRLPLRTPYGGLAVPRRPLGPDDDTVWPDGARVWQVPDDPGRWHACWADGTPLEVDNVKLGDFSSRAAAIAGFANSGEGPDAVDPGEAAQACVKEHGPAAGSLWTHYKGGRYVVVCCGVHQKTLAPVVVYRSLEDRAIWIRTLDDWGQSVKRRGKLVPRFSPS